MPDDVRITDFTGATWSAREIPASHIVFNDEVVEEHDTWLCFEPLQEDAEPARILRTSPRDWRSLPAEVLVRLLEEGEPVARGRMRFADDAELRRHLDELST